MGRGAYLPETIPLTGRLAARKFAPMLGYLPVPDIPFFPFSMRLLRA